MFFNEEYTNGSITTELVSPTDSEQIVIKAIVRPDVASERMFTGYAQEIVGDGYINKTSALENAETSAVGRALAMMGIGVIDSVASVDEINKAGQIEAKKNIPKDPFEQGLRFIKIQEDPEKIRSMIEKSKKSTKINQEQKAYLEKFSRERIQELTGEPF